MVKIEKAQHNLVDSKRDISIIIIIFVLKRELFVRFLTFVLPSQHSAGGRNWLKFQMPRTKEREKTAHKDERL